MIRRFHQYALASAHTKNSDKKTRTHRLNRLYPEQTLERLAS
jgi:hypothetical protein